LLRLCRSRSRALHRRNNAGGGGADFLRHPVGTAHVADKDNIVADFVAQKHTLK
jgi:hypothetical protein